jgi:hypothetical protein
MKASTSTTSLTGLVDVKIEEQECFICLEGTEPLVESKLLRTCGCKFLVHDGCWKEWMKEKTDWDCPICRRDVIQRHILPTPTTRGLAEGVSLINWQLCSIIFLIIALGAATIYALISKH